MDQPKQWGGQRLAQQLEALARKPLQPRRDVLRAVAEKVRELEAIERPERRAA
ncbi:MAG: hypothetical protein JW940_18685 [Polyangiaceae bacterium]|nr:hypothetical protein [Polyangiaceae bacterium]